MIEPNIMDLLKPEGFNALFEKNLSQMKGSTLPQAYQRAEEIFKEHFGQSKYSSYDSFRKVRGRLIKRK
jgi:hypothetical protein